MLMILRWEYDYYLLEYSGVFVYLSTVHIHSDFSSLLPGLNRNKLQVGQFKQIYIIYDGDPREPRLQCRRPRKIKTKPRLEVGELSLERNHGISRVWDGNVVKSRDGSRDLVGAKEGNDSELSKTSVVDLSEKALLLLLRRHVLKAGRRDDEIVSYCPTLGNADTVEICLPCSCQPGHKGQKQGGLHRGKEQMRGTFQADGLWCSEAELHHRHTLYREYKTRMQISEQTPCSTIDIITNGSGLLTSSQSSSMEITAKICHLAPTGTASH
jgi:hypothetical protein